MGKYNLYLFEGRNSRFVFYMTYQDYEDQCFLNKILFSETGICIMLVAFLFSTVVADDGVASDTKNNLEDLDGKRDPKRNYLD